MVTLIHPTHAKLEEEIIKQIKIIMVMIIAMTTMAVKMRWLLLFVKEQRGEQVENLNNKEQNIATITE